MKWIDFLLFSAVVILIISLSACNRNIETQSDDKNAFDLVGLIDSQVILLSKNEYGIQKFTKLGQKKENIELFPDSAGWVKELNIIKTTDINKPGLSPFYNLISSDSSVYSIDSYVLNDVGRSNVIYQKIYREKRTDHLTRIKIKQNIKNPIYHSSRFIDISFKKLNADQGLADSILVKGYQKIIFLDTAFYYSISKIVN